MLWLKSKEDKRDELNDRLKELNEELTKNRDLFKRCEDALNLLRKRIPKKEAERARILERLRALNAEK